MYLARCMLKKNKVKMKLKVYLPSKKCGSAFSGEGGYFLKVLKETK